MLLSILLRVQWTRQMCRVATISAALFLAGSAVWAQSLESTSLTAQDWRRFGNTSLDLGLGSAAGGPVDRVWYSANGKVLYGRTSNGLVWETGDLEHWTPARGAVAIPEGQQARASELTHLPASISFKDSAISPRNTEEIAIASGQGVWVSHDRGASWSGVNAGLTNFAVERLLSVAEGGSVHCLVREVGEVAWENGERQGWKPADTGIAAAEASGIVRASSKIAGEISAFAKRDSTQYAGTADGRLLTSIDDGATWRVSATASTARVLRIVVDGVESRMAVALTSSSGPGRILRTTNGGVVWEDVSGDFPAAKLQGVTMDRGSGSLYVASDRGLYLREGDGSGWRAIREGNIVDVSLDPSGNQLYIASESDGIFAGLAPHRLRDPRVVSAADRIARAAAPGSLVTILGARVEIARAGQLTAPILASNLRETEIQIPFEASGTAFALSLTSSSGILQRTLPLRTAAPAIFVDREGNPLLLDGDSGLMLDAGTPGRPGARVQILATGLGRVTPSWPSGLPAPLQDAPKVVAPIRVLLEREPLEILRATLAPGYVGMYLVEVRLPALLNPGTAELYIESELEQSNRVRLWLQP